MERELPGELGFGLFAMFEGIKVVPYHTHLWQIFSCLTILYLQVFLWVIVTQQLNLCFLTMC